MMVYCLKADELGEVDKLLPVLPWVCPFCGIINSAEETSYHVFNPSQPLLNRLQPHVLRVSVEEKIGIEETIGDG